MDCKRALLVEDEAGVRNCIEEFLKMMGFEVLTASCGKAAIKQMHENCLDLLVTDFRMDGGDGIEVIMAAFEMLKRSLPVIVMSGDRQDFFNSANKRITDQGILIELENRFIEKPFRFEKMEDMVKKVMA